MHGGGRGGEERSVGVQRRAGRGRKWEEANVLSPLTVIMCDLFQRRWRPCLGRSHHSWQEEIPLVAPLTPSFPSASLESNQETTFAP